MSELLERELDELLCSLSSSDRLDERLLLALERVPDALDALDDWLDMLELAELLALLDMELDALDELCS